MSLLFSNCSAYFHASAELYSYDCLCRYGVHGALHGFR